MPCRTPPWLQRYAQGDDKSGQEENEGSISWDQAALPSPDISRLRHSWPVARRVGQAVRECEGPSVRCAQREAEEVEPLQAFPDAATRWRDSAKAARWPSRVA